MAHKIKSIIEANIARILLAWMRLASMLATIQYALRSVYARLICLAKGSGWIMFASIMLLIYSAASI